MRRSAWPITLILAAICGCQQPATEMDAAGPDVYASPQPGAFQGDPAAELAAGTEPGVYATPELSGPAGSPPTAGTRTHRVVAGDTLYSLARRYYDSGQRWKDIYEANRGQLGDPKALAIDQVLVIP